jgi:hypothetical protein
MSGPREVSNCYPVCGLTGDHVYLYSGRQVGHSLGLACRILAAETKSPPAPPSLTQKHQLGTQVAPFQRCTWIHVNRSTGGLVSWSCVWPTAALGKACRHVDLRTWKSGTAGRRQVFGSMVADFVYQDTWGRGNKETGREPYEESGIVATGRVERTKTHVDRLAGRQGSR